MIDFLTFIFALALLYYTQDPQLIQYKMLMINIFIIMNVRVLVLVNKKGLYGKIKAS